MFGILQFREHGLQLVALLSEVSIETKVFVKPTNSGLLLHYHSHVDNRYKRGLLSTMLDRAYRLSSSWSWGQIETAENMAALNVDYIAWIITVLGAINSNHTFIFDLNYFL